MDSARTPRREELSVSELTRLVKGLVEGEPRLAQVWVRGEASNVRLIASGHLYFTLKDENSELRVAYFAYSKRRSKPPPDGEALLVHGDVRVYERRGEYQLVADDLIPAGKGDLAARFEALKHKLNAEGLFAEERKVPVPAVPKRIGIVTGAATAALADVLNVLRRRASYADVVLFPASVQGDSAPPEIIAALRAADACPGVEVVLLVRGGGSIEDLWCFNDEGLARALAEIRRPVITGVGHEIDFTIVDFIADRRAPTPSAAAELACPDAAELRAALDDRVRRMLHGAVDVLDDSREGLARLFDRRLIRDTVRAIEDTSQELDDYSTRLAAAAAQATYLGEERGMGDWVERMARPVVRRLDTAAHTLPLYRDDVLRAGRHGLDNRVKQLRAAQSQLTGLDPRAPKKLGFALVWDKDGKLVRDPEQVAPGDRLRVEVKEGEMDVRRE